LSPNGNQIIVNYSKNIFLNQHHVIDNVFYIPNFTFNLLSEAQSIDNLSLVITLTLMDVTSSTRTP